MMNIKDIGKEIDGENLLLSLVKIKLFSNFYPRYEEHHVDNFRDFQDIKDERLYNIYQQRKYGK